MLCQVNPENQSLHKCKTEIHEVIYMLQLGYHHKKQEQKTEVQSIYMRKKSLKKSELFKKADLFLINKDKLWTTSLMTEL